MNLKAFQIVVLISGRGSNLAGLLANQEHYQVKAVVSNNPNAPGLQFAVQAKIPTYCFERRDFVSMIAMKAAIRTQVASLQPALIALAGYMLIIEPEFVELFPSQIVNIHPSLLPAYTGLDTHKRALADQVKHHGCSVHQVDVGLDTGHLISQAALTVHNTENEDSLSQRVLALEHKLYPWTINGIASGQINLHAVQEPMFTTSIRQAALDNDFILGG